MNFTLVRRIEDEQTMSVEVDSTNPALNSSFSIDFLSKRWCNQLHQLRAIRKFYDD